jgi:hypothetical protein
MEISHTVKKEYEGEISEIAKIVKLYLEELPYL